MRTNLRRYHCAICATIFAKKATLVSHHRTHAPHRFRCAVCAKTFTTKSHCRDHELRHSAVNRRVQCHFCPRRFISNSERTRHERSRVHQGDDAIRIPCAVCGKAFFSQRNVKRHLIAHAGELPYGCAQCPERFLRRSAVLNHLRLHVLQAASDHVQCPHCLANFCKSNALSKHLRFHDETAAPAAVNLPAAASRRQQSPISTPSAQRCRNPAGELAFPCAVCGDRLSSVYRLRLHRLAAHRRKASCDVCGAEFADAFRLKRHLNIHTTDKRPLACARCTGRFKYKSDLAEHIRKFHRHRPALICAQCGAILPTYNLLVSHVVKHRAPKPFECRDFCGARFATRKELILHRRVHTREKPFACELCPARFAQLFNFRKHLLVHQRTKNVRCNVCNLWFPRRSQLAAHQLSNATDGAIVRYGCATCESYHGRKQSLKLHIMQVHYNDFGHPCSICAKHFKTQRALREHYARNSHDWNNYDGRSAGTGVLRHNYQCSICYGTWHELKPFTEHFSQQHRLPRVQCTVCTAFLDSSEALEAHLQRHAVDANPFVCPLCPTERFPNRRALRHHHSFEHSGTGGNRQPIFRCSICPKSFTTANSLRQHVTAVHTAHRAFECEVCRRRFVTRYHLKLHKLCHSSETTYACAICARRYKMRDRLQTHLAQCHLRSAADR